MEKWIKKYCDYLSEIYDCTYYVKNNILFINSNSISQSTFKVSLNDKNLSVYTLFHRNTHKIKESYHVQFRLKNLKKIIFIAMVHDFNKENNMFYEEADFYQTITDTAKIIIEEENKERYKKNKYIQCPICNRKLKVLNKYGDLRKNIHCRCILNHHHTTIQYKGSRGYFLMFIDKYVPYIKKELLKINS